MQLKNLTERLLREAVLHETLSGYETEVSVIGQKIEEGCCSLPSCMSFSLGFADDGLITRPTS
jgi:hypothetical protein